jgi:hypothetical protein
MNPLAAVAILARGGEAGPTFLGSCFAFRSKRVYLTAAHCVGDLAAHEVLVHGIHAPLESQRAAQLVRHPSADIVAVILQSGMESAEPFERLPAGYALGEDFYAHGFSEDVLGDSSTVPVPRAFKGYFQRFMDHTSFMGYRYSAAELSIGCPAGLSGGPLFSTEHVSAGFAYGIVTENVQSHTVLESWEEVERDGSRTVYRNQSVINYGVALLLTDLKDWLSEVAPEAGGGTGSNGA